MSSEAQLAPLRRQLGALSYDGSALTAATAPLVAALLGDLVKATDSYRTIKAQASEAGQASQNMQYQAEVLKREVGRLTAENNRLHQDLLREADARQAQEAGSYQRTKQLEAQVADLQFAKQQALQRAEALERERDALRVKVRELLSFGQHHVGDEAEIKAAFSRMTISRPLEPKPSPAAQAKTSRGAISLIKAADNRILALEADVRRKQAEAQALTSQLQQAQAALAQRDGEIARLSAQLAQGPDVDRLAQQYRNDANEAVILQLNQQVEALTAELTEVQRRAVDRSTLEAAQQAQQQAEVRANALQAEREAVAREVEQMQAALMRLQQEAAGETAARQKLGKVRATLESVRAEKALLEGQLTHAEAKVAELRDRLEQRESVLRKVQHKCKLLEAELADSQKQQHKAGASKADGTTTTGMQQQIASLTAQLGEARQAQQEAAAATAAAEEERQALQEQMQQFQQQSQEGQLPLADVVAAPAAPTLQQEATRAAEAAQGAEQALEADAADGRQQYAEKAAQLEQLEFERQELLVKLEESEAQVAALTAALAKQQQVAGLAADKAQLPVNPEGSSGSDAEWSLAAGPVDASQQAALDAARQQAEVLRLQVVELQGRVQQLEGQEAALQTELAAAQAGAGGAAVAGAAVADLRRQLEERSKEVADLSALSIKADSTVRQYMAQLQSMATEMRAAQLRLGEAEKELARRAEEVQRRDAELAELRGTIGALDAERDSLQAELDRCAEAAAAEASVLAAERHRAEEAERMLAATEARLAAAHSRIQEHEQAGQQQRAELEALSQHMAGMEAEYVALREEYRAVTDDLAALVKENQLVSNQLNSMTAEREELAEQMKVQSTRSHYNEQLARAREQDVSELRTAYEGLAHENQRLQQSLTELTRELQARDTELMTKAEEVASLHEAQRSAQSQINMYISDLQAYERQLDAMRRAMQRGDEAADGLDRERQALLEQLRTAEQVRFQLERTQEALQRQLVHAEGGIGVLEARLADAQLDGEALRQRIGLEQARVGELEGLLAIARADQFKRDAVAAESGADRQVASLQEQRRLLEEQVATLQRQVDGLVQRREAQDEELAQLRARLASEFELGATSGSRQVAQQGEALAQQLTEARQRCSELASEAEELRAEAARLAGASDGAELALQAVQAELAEVKGLLMQQEVGTSRSGAASAEAAAAARLAELEQDNRQLAAQLAALQAGADRQGQSATGISSKLEELQQENERLLELLAHMDSERARLSRERADLATELAHARAGVAQSQHVGTPSLGMAPSASGGSSTSASQQQQQQAAALEAELARERQRRQQAERDFRELLDSISTLQGSPSPSSSSGSLQGAAAPAERQQGAVGGGQLQAAVEQLQRENNALRGELQRTRDGTFAAAAATTSLQHIAQGLHSISSGGAAGSNSSSGVFVGRAPDAMAAGRSSSSRAPGAMQHRQH